MFLRRSAIALSQRAATTPAIRRSFTSSLRLRDDKPVDKPVDTPADKSADQSANQSANTPVGVPLPAKMKTLAEIRTMEDLLPPGAAPGTVPTDLEQSTGLERLELLGKMQGIDIFDMKPLDASRRGTLDNPIIVRSYGDEQHAGCTGFPASSHWVIWLRMSRERPVERCPECGGVYRMEYVGPPDDPHAHGHDDHHGYERPKTFADYVRNEYRM